MVEAGVSPECLGEGAHAGQLDVRDLLGPVLHGAGEPGFQGLHTTLLIITKPQPERWPLLTVENEANGDSQSSDERGSSLFGLLGLPFR
jgi:hypothetical protein